MPGQDRALLRVDEAAGRLGISRARAYALVQSGELPSVRLGRSLRVPVRQLDEWVDEQVRAARSAPLGIGRSSRESDA